MALSFFAMIASGLVMEHVDVPQKLKFNMYQWHKSLGVLLLLALISRVLIRVRFKAPKLPKEFSSFDRKAAKLGHFMLYAWMLILPMTGWLMVSSSPYGLPTIVFDWFYWPHIPWVESHDMINALSKLLHKYFAYGFIALIILHIAAVAKHAFKDGLNLLPRMWFLRRKRT